MLPLVVCSIVLSFSSWACRRHSPSYLFRRLTMVIEGLFRFDLLVLWLFFFFTQHHHRVLFLFDFSYFIVFVFSFDFICCCCAQHGSMVLTCYSRACRHRPPSFLFHLGRAVVTQVLVRFRLDRTVTAPLLDFCLGRAVASLLLTFFVGWLLWWSIHLGRAVVTHILIRLRLDRTVTAPLLDFLSWARVADPFLTFSSWAFRHCPPSWLFRLGRSTTAPLLTFLPWACRYLPRSRSCPFINYHMNYVRTNYGSFDLNYNTY